MKKLITLFALLLLTASAARAGDWPNWRGPSYNGSTDEKNLPVKFSPTENVAWVADMPGPSAATPVVAGDHVFVSSTNPAGDELVAICLDRKTGEKLWQHNVSQGIRKDSRSTYSAPSPATDGKTVVFFYGNGEMIAYDFAGEQKWERNVGPFGFGWTFSTSPVIFDGKLYMQVLQHGPDPSFILAMEPGTGETIWKQTRPSKAQAESMESFNTPMPYVHGDRRELLVAGGDCLTGHDLATGKELWRWGTWNPERIGHWRLVPSPVAGGGVVLACAPKRDPVYAIKLGGSGVLKDDSIAWISRDEREVSSDVPSPAFYDGDFFVLSDVRKALSRVEPMTGKVKWTVQTPSRAKYEASPLAGDGKIYLMNFDGDVNVMDAAFRRLFGSPTEPSTGSDRPNRPDR